MDQNHSDLRHLIDLVGLLVWSDDGNSCGIRDQDDPEHKQVLEKSGERLTIFRLAQHIRGAGRWLEGTDTSEEARTDGMDLPLIAFHVASSSSEPVQRVLGQIIERESILAAWNRSKTDPLQVFAAWAEQVRGISIRLAAANKNRFNTYAKPWS